jgi:hypothetical protein
MKKILIALIVIGVANFSADAKDKKNCINHSQNYKVCQSNGTYQICGQKSDMDNKTTMHKRRNVDQQAWMPPMTEPTSMLSMNTVNSYEGFYKKHNIIVSDDMHKPYEGEASRQYDGPAKNDYRNMNVNQTSMFLPPSSGAIEGRR